MSKRKPKRRKQSSSSLVIPVVAGVVVLVLIVGIIAFSEARRPPGSASSSSDTAQPLNTQSIPYPNVPRIALQEAKGLLDSSEAVLVDVRSKESFDKSHAVGAVSIPESEIEARLEELPRNKDVVLY